MQYYLKRYAPLCTLPNHFRANEFASHFSICWFWIKNLLSAFHHHHNYIYPHHHYHTKLKMKILAKLEPKRSMQVFNVHTMYIYSYLKLKTSKCLQNTFFHLKSGRSHSFLNNLPISLSSSSCQFPFSNNKQKQKIVYTLFKHLFTILNILIAVFFSLLSIFISKDKKKLIKNRMMVFF